jgi:tetratricopeptide (TPR) repeat protein
LLGGLGVTLLALALVLLLLGPGGASTSAPPAAAPPSTEASIRFWEDRVRRDPADFVAYNRLAAAYMQRARETGDVSDYSRAQAAVDASLAQLPGDNPGAYSLLAALQNVRHEFAAAVASAERALSLDPTDQGALAARGDAQLALGRYEEALRTYSELTARAPGLASFARMAHIYELRGEIGEAELAWRNAFSTDSGRNPEATAWARVQYGHFLFGRGDLDGAAEQYDAALAAFPDYVHGLAGLARVAAARGELDRAIELYSQVADRRPTPEFVAALGDVYRLAGREADAQRQYELVGVIDQLYRANGVNTDLQIALFWADHGIRVDEAVTAAEAVYRQQPDSIAAADALAWALYSAGRPGEARPYIEQALRLGTQDATLFYHAGMIYRALGEHERARSFLERALDLNPHFSLLHAPLAREALEEQAP